MEAIVYSILHVSVIAVVSISTQFITLHGPVSHRPVRGPQISCWRGTPKGSTERLSRSLFIEFLCNGELMPLLLMSSSECITREKKCPHLPRIIKGRHASIHRPIFHQAIRCRYHKGKEIKKPPFMWPTLYRSNRATVKVTAPGITASYQSEDPPAHHQRNFPHEVSRKKGTTQDCVTSPIPPMLHGSTYHCTVTIQCCLSLFHSIPSKRAKRTPSPRSTHTLSLSHTHTGEEEKEAI